MAAEKLYVLKVYLPSSLPSGGVGVHNLAPHNWQSYASKVAALLALRGIWA